MNAYLTFVRQLDGAARTRYRHGLAEAERRDRIAAACDALGAALAGQHDDLIDLCRRTRSSVPAHPAPALVPAVDPDEALQRAYGAAQAADDALDAAQEAASRPRFLAGWPPWLRNGLVYAVCAVLTTAAFGLFTVVANRAADFRWGSEAFLAVPCCGMPLLAFGLGVLVVGRLFAPRLGGAPARTPVFGLAVSFAVPWLCCGGVVAAF